MTDLNAIIRATRASASAVAARQRWARQAAEAARDYAYWARQPAEQPGDMARISAKLRLAKDCETYAIQNRRRAHARWLRAQSILAANPLPGDPA